MKSVLLLVFLIATPVFANQPALGVNLERIELMEKTLQSERARAVIQTYGQKGFVLHGMSWVNTYQDGVFHFNLQFKKFDMEVTEKDGQKAFNVTTLICDHLVTLETGDVRADKPLNCRKVTESADKVF